MMMLLLLKRSARNPDEAEKNKKWQNENGSGSGQNCVAVFDSFDLDKEVYDQQLKDVIIHCP